MNERDEARRHRFTQDIAGYRAALDAIKATAEFKAAEGEGLLVDVRDQFIALLESSIATRERLIIAIDDDTAQAT